MNNSAARYVVDMNERIDIAGAEALHGSLEDALAAGTAISLDGSKVTKIDTAGVQVIDAFWQEAEKLHLEVDWLNPSPTLFQVFGFLGLSNSVRLHEQD